MCSLTIYTMQEGPTHHPPGQVSSCILKCSSSCNTFAFYFTKQHEESQAMTDLEEVQEKCSQVKVNNLLTTYALLI